MIKLLNSSIGRLRIISFLEGISLVILLGITMPLKYTMNMHQLSFIAGMVHGVLFLLFLLLLLSASIEHRWKFGRVMTIVFFSCLIPFGFLYTDKRLANTVTG